jgi:hypothetical protein
MKLSKILLYELMLIFASVFIFGSLWMIYDKVAWMNSTEGIILSLVVGVGVTLIALVKLNKIIDKKGEK